jgi:energy-coupling factor transporter ATP-binding protein EcfA2
MLKSLRLANFKGFENHLLPLRPTTVVIGPNNAGKSTIIEALRLVSIVVNRLPYLTFQGIPGWLTDSEAFRGVAPSLRGMEVHFPSIFHRYSDPPAVIDARFVNDSQVRIYLGPDESLHAVIRDKTGAPLTTRAAAAEAVSRVAISPQVGPLAREERLLELETVRSASSSHLAPLHFRNQLYYFSDLFGDFQEAAEATWPGFRVLDLELTGSPADLTLALLVQDQDFVAEVGWMGHGLQMWLQMVWFLTRSRLDSTVVLDEPDVYMHADLQLRLMRFLRGRNPQVIVATHSIEIMGDAVPEEVLMVDRRRRRSRFADSLPAVQHVAETIGSPHNLQLARLWTARRFVLIEGDDLDVLAPIYDKLYPRDPQPLDLLPNMSIGGWGGWRYAIGSSMALQNAAGQEIKTYCILDSDYHTDNQKNEVLEEAHRRSVNVHIWSRKELENFLLVPAAIQRVIAQRIGKGRRPPNQATVIKRLNTIAEGLRDDVLYNMASEFLKEREPRQDPGDAVKLANETLQQLWTTEAGRTGAVSGKKVLSELSKWSKSRYGVSFGVSAVVRAIEVDEIPDEMRQVLRSIREAEPFPAAPERRTP